MRRRKTPLFILEGNGSCLNRGCEAILRSTVSILREEFGACRFINIPGSPVQWPAYREPDPDIVHKLRPEIRRWHRGWWRLQLGKMLFGRTEVTLNRYLRKSIAVLAIGGDNYSLDYGVPRRPFRVNREVLARGKPLILWGASVGPFGRDPQFEQYAASELRRVTLICARESETVAYLDRIGVRENVKLVSDPAFLLEPEAVELAGREQIILKEPCVGLNVSALAGRYRTGETHWVDDAATCVEAILNTVDVPIVLVPHVIYPGNDDHDFMKQIRARLPRQAARLILIGSHYNAQQLKWIIAKLSVFVGARTHSTIAALSSHIPTISIGYSVKARGINKDIFGHCDWLIRVDSLTPPNMAEIVGSLVACRSQVKAHLARVMPAYKLRARKAARYVREVIGPGISG